MTAKEDGRLVEMFATGTAAVVTPVGNILYEGKMHAINHSILHSDDFLISDRWVSFNYTVKYALLQKLIEGQLVKVLIWS